VDAQAYLTECARLVDRRLEALLPPVEEPPVLLHAAMRHLVFPGGKRLRPALACAGVEAVGGRPEQALPVAAAVELVHTYSLIHDDLPCMDDDDERRGRPTVHVAFGEGIAVLAGDALLAAAFGALTAEPLTAPAERVLATVRDLADAAGWRHLVGGQADDLGFDASAAGAAAVESVHRRKSAALIATSLVGGACLAGADATRLARLRRCGERLGVAFQIADDLLDRDREEACSLVRALGAEAARARAAALLGEALDAIEPLGEPAAPLRELARLAVWRER
jgi:geranylgeranyl diphosphate synthase type II